MNEQVQAIAKKRIVVEVMGAVTVRRDIEIAIEGADTIAVDVYQPDRPSRIAVVIVGGYPDRGFQSFLGCRFKEMGWVVSWAELLATSGVTAIAYSASDPLRVNDLLQRIRDGAIDGIRGDRIGVLASSGSGPVAMSLLRRDAAVPILCAAFLCVHGRSRRRDQCGRGVDAVPIRRSRRRRSSRRRSSFSRACRP